jgi:hypothetical protein
MQGHRGCFILPDSVLFHVYELTPGCHIANVLLGEGVRLSRLDFDIFALCGAVKDSRPGGAVGAHLRLGVVIGASVAVAVSHDDLIHRESFAQIDLQVL